jgi:secreted trypsin-like serine protease
MPTKQTPTRLTYLLGASVVVLISLDCTLATAAGRVQADAKVPGIHPRTRAANRQDPAARASVIGGEPAAPGTFPWMAFVVDISGNEGSACSGTVVAPNLVLTAGHCPVDTETGVTNEAADYRVVTGVVDWTNPERQVSHVSQVLAYPHMRIYGYYDDGWGDATLLVLSTPTTAPAIPLATRADANLLGGGTDALVAGWGDTEYQ